MESEPQRRTLSRARRYGALGVLICFIALSGMIGVLVGIELVVVVVHGGFDAIIRTWSSPTSLFEGIAGLVGGGVGMAVGYWGWKKFSLAVGLLTPSQLEELYEPE